MKIGLTYTGAPGKHANYERWLKGGDGTRAGASPPATAPADEEGSLPSGEKIEVIRLSADDNNLSAIDECDALVLSGGVDIHPSFYDGEPDYASRPERWREDRDNFEIAALKQAWQQGKPVLAVCRGLQLINVVCGGTLVQDLGVQGDETHQNRPVDMEHPNKPTDKEHSVRVEEGSLLHDISGHGGWINSAHHQAIARLGEGLRVNCRAEDGVIEGVEWASPAGRPFMLAVQWHPERMFTNGFRDRELYMNIRDRFIEEIKKTIEQ